MKIYNYSAQTGEFIKASEARKDPLESKPGYPKYLMPQYSTVIEPPAVGKPQIAVQQYGNWVIMDDFRDTVYFIGSDSRLITDIGIEPPPGSTTEPAPKDFEHPFYDGYKWIDQVPDPVIPEGKHLKLTPGVIKDLAEAKDFDEFITKLKDLSEGVQ